MSLTDAQRERFENARPTMHALATVAWTWCELEEGEIRATFPALYDQMAVGWDEPFCFRCGFLPPVKAAGTYAASVKPKRQFAFSWEAAGGWLERAHLQDHRDGGGNEPLDMVPLCVLCHLVDYFLRAREREAA